MDRAHLVSRPENSDDLRRRMLNILFAGAVAVATLLMIGCGDTTDVDRDRGSGNQAVGSTDSSGASNEMTGSSATDNSATVQSQTIAVMLKDGEISMPTIIKPGPTTFNVTNSGQGEHGFEIEGAGHETGLNADLDAGATASFEVDLQPGTYTAYCPEGDHKEKGMTLQVNVQP